MKMKKHECVVTLLITLISVYVQAQTTGGWAGLTYKDTKMKYGKWEMRMRLIEGGNMVNAFYLIQYKPVWHEIDVEIRGNATRHIETCIHIYDNQTWLHSPWRYGHHPFPFSLTEDYHTYGIEWTPNYISWQFDGNEYRRAETQPDGSLRDRTFNTGGVYEDWRGVVEYVRDTIISAADNYVTEMQNAEMQLDFNIWMGCDTLWCGKWTTQNCGKAVFLSWFRYFKYRPGEGANGSDFVLEYADNFDSPTWDDNRWINLNSGDMQRNINGKAVATMNCRELGTLETGFNGTPPYDAGDTGDLSTGARNSSLRITSVLRDMSADNGAILFNIQGRKVFTLSGDDASTSSRSAGILPGAYILRSASPSASAVSKRIFINGLNR